MDVRVSWSGSSRGARPTGVLFIGLAAGERQYRLSRGSPTVYKFAFRIFLHALSNPAILPDQLQEDIAVFLQFCGADPVDL